MGRKLKIGLLIESFFLPFWQYAMIKKIIDSDYATIELIILKESEENKITFLKKLTKDWRKILFHLYCKFDQKMFKCDPDAFELKDIRTLLGNTRLLKVKTISKKFSDQFREEDIKKIKPLDLDVLIRLGTRVLKGDILTAARFGVWSYHHGDNNVNRGGPPGFWEVMEGATLTGSVLQILTDDLDSGRILYRSYSSTDKISVYRNKNKLYWKSMSFLPRKLKELQGIGEKAFFEKIEKLNEYPSFYSKRLYSGKELTNWRMLKFIWHHLWRAFKIKLFELFYFEQWFLMYSKNQGIGTSFWRFKKIIPPKDRFWADPYIIFKDGRYYVFVEEFMYKNKKGHISLLIMDGNGNYEGPFKILEKPFHLSHPFVFKWRGDYYMVPETLENKTIELYRCVEFPYQWEFRAELMKDVRAVDPILFYFQEKWWLFVNLVENEGASSWDELFLFYADDLLAKSWHPHPLNPVISDVRRARPAGKIFSWDGKIYRPSQNCSERYGYGFNINVIEHLSTTDYQEKEIASIKPEWDKKIKATHTFNNENGLTFIDGLRKKLRYFL